MTTRLVDIVLWFFGILPESAARFLGAAIAFLAHRILRFRVNAVRRHLAIALPNLPESEHRKLEKGFYHHLGHTAIEMLRLPRMTDQQVIDRTQLHGLEHFEKALANGHGLFILAAHLGNWEMGLAGCATRGYETYTVTKEVKGKAGQHFLDSIRDAHGVKGIARRNSIKEIFRLLKRNQAVGFVIDQNMTAEEGVFVDFFGKKACTMPGLAVMARRSKAAVIPTLFWRDDKHRHHVELWEPVEWDAPAGMTTEELILHNTQRYSRVTEKMILEHPEQWMWMHKRWRTRPPEESCTTTAPENPQA